MTSNQSLSRSMWLVLAVLVLAEFNCAFEASMIYVALTKLNAVYGDPVIVGWLITGFLLASAVAAALCSRLGDKYGRRTMLLWMLAFALAGSVVSAVSSQLEWIIVGRALQGISAAILPLCFGLVRERLPAEHVPFGIGIVAGTAQLGAAAGYSIGGVIIDYFDWQSLFRVSAIMAVLGLLAVWGLLKPQPVSQPAAASEKLDILGGILFVPGIVGILLAITNARSWGWLSQPTLALIAASLLVLAIWVRHELRHPSPMLDVRLLLNRQIAFANLCFALAALGVIQSQLILFPLLLQPEWTGVGLGMSATLTGALKGGILVFGAACSSWAGVLAGRHGGRYALLIGALTLTAAWMVLTFFHASVWVVLSINVASMFGTAFIYSSVANLVVETAPPERASEASGMSAVVRAVFGAVGAQIIAYLLASSTIANPTLGPGRYPDENAYTLALAWVTLTSVACLLCGLLLPRRKPVAPLRPASAH